MTEFHEGQEVEVAKAWQNCPSTHCERSQECRSPHECNGWRKAKIVHPKPGTPVLDPDYYVAQFHDDARAVFNAEHIRPADRHPDFEDRE